MKIAILLLLILFSFSCRKSTPVVTKTKYYQCTVHLNELNKAKYIEVSQDGNLLKTIDYQYDGNKLTLTVRDLIDNNKFVVLFRSIGNVNYVMQSDTQYYNSGFKKLRNFKYLFKSDSTFDKFFLDNYSVKDTGYQYFNTYEFYTKWNNRDIVDLTFFPGSHYENDTLSSSNIVDSLNLFPLFVSDYRIGWEPLFLKNHHLNLAVSFTQWGKFSQSINQNHYYNYRINQDQRVDEIVKHYMESSLEYLTEITQVVYVK